MGEWRRSLLGAGVLVALLMATGAAWAAGGRTHMEMGQRALHEHICNPETEAMLPGLDALFSSDELKKVFYCGCTSPDWGYPTPGYHDAAEDMHWRPFQDAYCQYLTERFPPPWNDEARRQVAFFLGAIVHGMTDTAWEFSDGQYLSMSGIIDQHDKDQGASSDTALDVHVYTCFPLDVNLTGFAWWPYDTLIEVYKRQGRDVARDGLTKGTNLLETAWNFGTRFGALGNLRYASTYPWGKAHLVDYDFGGLNHGGAMASMWIKYFYARLNGWHYFQCMPVYPPKPPSYVPYTGVQDAQVVAAHPASNTGAEPILEFTGGGPNDARAALIRFDLSQVPPDTRVKSATLWLYFAGRRGSPQTADKTIEAYGVRRPWREGARQSDPISGVDGQPAQPGEVTWIETGVDGARWAQPGCSGAGTDRDVEAVSRVVVTPKDPEGHWKAWDVTSLAATWVAHPDSNHGVLLRESESSTRQPGILQFYSSQAWQVQPDKLGGGRRVAWRPALVLVPEETPH